MKLLLLLAAAAAALSAAASAAGPRLSQIKLDYHLKKQPLLDPHEPAEVEGGETVELVHSFTNNEDSKVVIVGVGGHFSDPLSGDILQNMTTEMTEMVAVGPGELRTVRQLVPIDLDAGAYVMTPSLVVAFEEQYMLAAARDQLVVVVVQPLLLWSPQLLFLEALVVLFAAGGVYLSRGTPKPAGKPAGKPKGNPAPRLDPAWVPAHHHAVKTERTRRRKY